MRLRSASSPVITAEDLLLLGDSGLGTADRPLIVDLDRLYGASLPGGPVHVENTGDLFLGGLAVQSGDLWVMSDGVITVDKPLTVDGGGNLSLIANGTGTVADPLVLVDETETTASLFVRAPVTTSGGDGNINLLGKDDVRIEKPTSPTPAGQSPATVSSAGHGQVVISSGTVYRDGEPGLGEWSADIVMEDGSIVFSEHGNIVLQSRRDVWLSNLRTASDSYGNDGEVQIDANYEWDVEGVEPRNEGNIFDNLSGDLPNITADGLTVLAATGIDLVTESDRATLVLTGTGNIALKEISTNGTRLVEVIAADGAVDVISEGTVIADEVRVLNGLLGNDVKITVNAGDIQVDSISVDQPRTGDYEGLVYLTASGDIFEKTGAIDADDDVGTSSYSAGLHFQAEGIVFVASDPSQPKDIEVVLTPLRRNLIIRRDGDYTIDRDVTGYVDVQVTGNIYVNSLTAGADNAGLDILLKAGGNIYIDYLQANAAGTVRLDAGNHIQETSADTAVDIDATSLTANAGVAVTVEGIRTVSATTGGSIQGPSDSLVLEISVDTLHASAPSGSVYIDEQDALTLGSDLSIAGTLDLTTGGNLTISGDVNAGAAGDVNLIATGDVTGGQVTG
ncbi:MAG TPA: hypothetical protein EYQ83_17930, partial [Acidobacteria bacterium]|nr:hypothetical protein [Acidobacteriota bacterium]